MPQNSGAVFVPDFETLIISDLHLEQGSSLARRGLHVPPFDTAMTLDLLDAAVSQSHAKRIVFLGDSFHDAEGETRLSESHISRLRNITDQFETFWVSGNHDPHPPTCLGGTGANSIALGALTLRHEPTRQGGEIAGHLHPGCAVSQRGRQIRGKCFIADGQRLIMPAFGAYTGGLSINSAAFSGLFDHVETKVWMIGKSGLHRFSLNRLNRP